VAAAEKDGPVLAGRRAIGGGAEIGVAVRAGRFAAKSVSFTDSAGSGVAAVFVAGLLDRLGVADAVEKKAVPFNTGRGVIAATLKGDADADCEQDRYRI
jgi:hypothetical protein